MTAELFFNGEKVATAVKVEITTKPDPVDPIVPITIGEVHVEGIFRATNNHVFCGGRKVMSRPRFTISVDPVSRATLKALVKTLKTGDPIIFTIGGVPFRGIMGSLHATTSNLYPGGACRLELDCVMLDPT